MDVQSVTPATGETAEVAQASTPGATSTSAANGAVASGQPASPAQAAGESSTLTAAIAKLYNIAPSNGSSSSSHALDVSYKVVGPLDLVVTVLSNPVSGQEVVQIPPEVLIGLAEFFDHLDGVTLDQKV
jgi:uncharacterized FlaG/YvyC family protein